MKSIAHFFVLAGTAMVLAACNTGEAPSPAAGASAQDFAITSVQVSTLTEANLCSSLGGAGAPPEVTIRHTPQAGVPLKVRLYDSLSNGSTFEHRSTRVSSDASGTTVVSHRFLPPCNTTNGRVDSTYRVEVSGGGDTSTVTWGSYDSGARRIR